MKVKHARNNKELILLTKLKFQNQYYEPGDNIALNGDRKYYGRILEIASVKDLQFPVLLIAWFYGKEDIIDQKIGEKELLLS